jgi:virginiamycin B lyase
MKLEHRVKLVSFGLLLALLISVLPLADAHAEDDAINAAVFTQYSVQGSPKNIVLESDARIWFTMPDANKIGLLTGVAVSANSPEAASIQYFDTGAGTRPYDLIFNGGYLWFTMLGSNQIGRLTPASGAIKTYNIPTANSEPTGITAGAGFIWFVERKGDNLGRLNPANGAIAEYTDKDPNDGNLVDMTGAELEDVAWSAYGPWLTGPKFRTSVAYYAYTSSKLNKFVGAPAGSGAKPIQIATDGASTAWLAARGINQLGRFDPATMTIWSFCGLPDVPDPTDGIVGVFVRVNAQGVREVWFTQPSANQVGRQLVSPGGTCLGQMVVPLPAAGSAAWGVAADSSGSAWFAASGANQIVVWRAPYFNRVLNLSQLSRNLPD